MLDQDTAATRQPDDPATQTYDLVVVGAGIAGLNALFAARDYLPAGGRALLIDQKPQAGGMWNTCYDYVALHQPHPMFTVGDIPWRWNRPATYLAQRDEIRDHLAGTLDRIAETLPLDTRFGHTVISCDEVETPDGPRARLRFHPNDDPCRVRSVEATRAVHASGFDYHAAEPLPLSSKAVVSIIPQDLRETLAAHPGAPVYVIGGGKTGMDTILETWSPAP